MMLGNLSIGDMEKRLGIKFPAELVEFMNANYQHTATDIAVGKWHCFDLPFNLVCGDKDTAKKIVEFLTPFSGDMLTQINIAWVN